MVEEYYDYILACHGLSWHDSSGRSVEPVDSTQAATLWFNSGRVLVIASWLDYVAPWWYVLFAHHTHQLVWGGLAIFFTALLKAIIFPIVHQLGTLPSPTHIRRAVLRVYVVNIFGATAGPLITGVGMLAVFTIQECFAIDAALTFLLASISEVLHCSA